MTDLQRPAHLEHWNYPKPSVRHDRSDSGASQQSWDQSDAVKIQPEIYEQDTGDYQDRYLSSEEDLSSMEDIDESLLDFDYEDVDVVDARAVTINIPTCRPRSCDFAQLVCLIPAGKPQLIDVPPTPIRERRSTSSRSSSANRSIASRSSRKSTEPELTYSPSESGSTDSTALSLETKSAYLSAEEWSQSSASIGESIERPSLSYATQTSRQNSALSSTNGSRTSSRPTSRYWAITPLSPASGGGSFLNSDPFDSTSRSSASPTIEKIGTHKRLRSISRSLNLARIAIGSKKETKKESQQPSNPTTPRTPFTPESAVPSNQTIKRKLVARGADERAKPMELPPMLETQPFPERRQSLSARPKMMARGAGERAPPVRLPSFVTDSAHEADDETVAPKKTLRRRKSMLGLV